MYVFAFLAKIRKFKMATIFGEKYFFLKIGKKNWSKILMKSLYLAWLMRQKQICVFEFFATF